MNRFDSFSEYVEEAMHSWHSPGLALAVIKGDKTPFEGAFGLANSEENRPMTADTRFAVASCTKAVTAMSVALLVDDGKLGWDQPVREIMPELVLADDYATKHATLRDMLCHRTGLPRHDLTWTGADLPAAEP